MDAELATANRICRENVRQQIRLFPIFFEFLPIKTRDVWTTTLAFFYTQLGIVRASNKSTDEKIDQLADMEQKLKKISMGQSNNEDPLFYALSQHITKLKLPIEPFYTQIAAFQEYLLQNRYQTQTEVLDYCQKSIAPIGHVLLHAHQLNTIDMIFYSDAICAALQMTQFLRNMHRDFVYYKRIYLPLQEFRHIGLPPEDFLNPRYSRLLEKLIALQVRENFATLAAGRQILKELPFYLRWRVAIIIAYIENLLHRLNARREKIDKPLRLSIFNSIKIAFRTAYLVISK